MGSKAFQYEDCAFIGDEILAFEDVNNAQTVPTR
jgi:hypothetical protein